MARKHVIKYWARLVQKGTFKEHEVPEDIRAEVMATAITLPPRKSIFDETPEVKEEVEVKEETADPNSEAKVSE